MSQTQGQRQLVKGALAAALALLPHSGCLTPDQDPDAGAASAVDCEEVPFEPPSATVDLLLVVDRSGSMNEVSVGSTTTKWQELQDVIVTIADEVGEQIGLGLVFFPAITSDQDLCAVGEVMVPIDLGTGEAISASFTATTPYGGTPTAASLEASRAYLSQENSTRRRAAVLATDGAPNCNDALDATTCVCSQDSACGEISEVCLDDDATVAAAAALAETGVPTYVVGIAGSESFADVLDRVVEAGGTARDGPRQHYDAQTPEEMAAALRSIGGRFLACRLELERAPLNDPIVRINGSPPPPDPGGEDGWALLGPRTIAFSGRMCWRLVLGLDSATVRYCY